MSNLTYKNAHRHVESPQRFDELVDEYVAYCEQEARPVTISGLTLFMGFATRQSFYDYGKAPEYERSVARARLIVADQYELRLHGQSPTGAIFALKNMGWSDQQRIDLGNADDKPFEVSGDVDRAARLASLLATAQARAADGDDEEEELA